MIYDVLIIGGGPSGMMASIEAARTGGRILLLEKNPTFGKKLSITGGGRCNITNAQFDRHLLLRHYGESGKRLHSAFVQFGVQETFDFFHKLGLPLVVEDRLRAFPTSQRADDVVSVLAKEMRRLKVGSRCNISVKNIVSIENDTFYDVVTASETFRTRKLIIATGGLSHPETGSTGDGFRWLKNLGHTVVPPTSTLVPLIAKESWVRELSGLTLEDVSITFRSCDSAQKFSKRGSLLFTHTGISGPMILNSALEVKKLLESGEVSATVNLFPSLNEGELDKKVLAILSEKSNHALKNILATWLPKKIVTRLMAGIFPKDESIFAHSVTYEQRKALIKKMQAFPLTITALESVSKSIVADGGVPLDEVDTRTMMSRIRPNLFIMGDLLHINRPSGGFSLQLCWTTGFVAGKNASA